MMDVIWIGLFAFSGGVLAGLAGILGNQEDFILRKFMATVIRALFAGFGTAIMLAEAGMGEFSWAVGIMALLMGAGVDVTGHRIAGAIRNR
jgi:hypothetical protein